MNVYFLLVVWYYFQRLGDPLDPMTGTNSGNDVTNSEAVGGVVVTSADLEVLENGKGSSDGPNPFPDNPFA